MNRINRTMLAAAAGCALLMSLAAGNVSGQERPNRGNFDPEQFRQRAMERYREALEVKGDDEWKVIETRITKVMDARRAVGGPGGPGGFFGRGGGRRGGGDAGGDQGGGNRPRFGGEPNPDAEALQKAIEAKAPADEIKSKLAKYRESRKARETKLTEAQDELRKVLSVRQEASAVLAGLLQ